MKDAVVIIVRNIKGQILFLNRKSAPFGYGLPGGKVEESDKCLKDACLRELKEETGINIHEKWVSYRWTTPCDREMYNVHIFESSMYVDESEITISSEHSDYIFEYESKDIDYAGRTREFIL